MGTTSVCATFVHATSNRATVFHTTFVQGQNLVVYICKHSCLDQTIKFQTSYRAEPELSQLQLMLSLAQLSPSLLFYLFSYSCYVFLGFWDSVSYFLHIFFFVLNVNAQN